MICTSSSTLIIQGKVAEYVHFDSNPAAGKDKEQNSTEPRQNGRPGNEEEDSRPLQQQTGAKKTV